MVYIIFYSLLATIIIVILSFVLIGKNEDIKRLRGKNKENRNPYRLSPVEYQRVQELNSKTVKIIGGSGIGMGVSCLDKNGKWVDITDYKTW